MASGRNVNQIVGLGTPMIPWKIARSAAAEDASGAATFVNGLDYDTVEDANPGIIVDLYSLFRTSVNEIVFAIWAQDFGGNQVVEDDNGGFQLFAYRTLPSDPVLVCECDDTNMIVGTMQALSPDGQMDNITAGEAFWIDTVSYAGFSDWVGGVTVFDSTNDRKALTRLDTMGYRYWYWRFHNVLGSEANEPPSVGVAVFPV